MTPTALGWASVLTLERRSGIRQLCSCWLNAGPVEMRRRLEWLEKHTGRYDIEAVVLGMQRELQGPSIYDLTRASGLRVA